MAREREPPFFFVRHADMLVSDDATGDHLAPSQPMKVAAGVSALSPGDKIECGVDAVGTLKASIGKPK